MSSTGSIVKKNFTFTHPQFFLYMKVVTVGSIKIVLAMVMKRK